MPPAKRNYRPLLALSAACYALLAGTGMLYSIRTFGHPPNPATNYSTSIDRLLDEGDADGAIAQLRLAVKIDVLNLQAAAALVQLARQRGDLDSEILALRRIHRSNPLDVDAHNAVAEALLRRRPIRSEDAEQVVQHSEIVLRLDPHSTAAHQHLRAALEALGQSTLAAEHRREARRLMRGVAAAPEATREVGKP